MSTRAKAARLFIAATTALFASPTAAQDLPCFGDFDGNRRVTVAELVLAVNNLLEGCSTPLPTRPPVATPTPGSIELQILQELGAELIPGPGVYGCSTVALGAADERTKMTCELPTAFLFVMIERFGDSAAARAAFDSMRGELPTTQFRGLDAFEHVGEAVGGATRMSLWWLADRWTFESTQVTAYSNVEDYQQAAERVVDLAAGRGLHPASD